MKKTRITAGIIVVLGIGIYLVTGSYSVIRLNNGSFFCNVMYGILYTGRRKKDRICSGFSRKRRKRTKHRRSD